MLAFVQEGNIIVEPCDVPKSWRDPNTGITHINFSNLSLEEMYALGWKNVDDTKPVYNDLVDDIVYSAWYYDVTNDIVKRDHTLVERSFPDALTRAYSVLAKNRAAYEISGFTYNYNGTIDLIIQTDIESQNKLSATRVAAENGTRDDTDIWKFKQTNGTNYVIPVTNAIIIDMSNFIFRKIQDSYNLMGSTSLTMLSTGDTATLKSQLEGGTINLSPWSS